MQTDLKAQLQGLIDKGMSQEAIAEGSGVHQTTISRILRGSGCRMDTYLRLTGFISKQSKKRQAAA